MLTKKFDLSGLNEDVFYKIIYPVFAKEFLFFGDYELFANLVGQRFKLSSTQWESVLIHWEQKESIISIEDC